MPELHQTVPAVCLAAYKDISHAIAQLAGVRLGFFSEHRDREANAAAIRSARSLVESARAHLSEPDLPDGALHALALLKGLPRGRIVEPFGPLHMEGGRSLEASGAARDRADLERALAPLRQTLLAHGDATVRAEVAELDRQRSLLRRTDWMLVTWRNPVVWGVALLALWLIATALRS